MRCKLLENDDMRLKIPRAPAPKKNRFKKMTAREIIGKMKKGYKLKAGKYRRGGEEAAGGYGSGFSLGLGGAGGARSEVAREREKITEGLKEFSKEQEIGAFKITLAKEEEKGLDIPSMEIKEISRTPLRMEYEEEKKKTLQEVNIYYNLIPRFPKQGEIIYAYAHIKWDAKQGELVYNIVEPKITERDMDLIEMVKRELEERLDVDFAKIGATKAESLLLDEIEKILKHVEDTTEEKRQILAYYIKKEIIGLGKIESMMQDPNIEDISCDGIGIPIYVYHRDPKIGSLKTNLFFVDKDTLDTFTVKLAQKCQKTISIAEPLLDATLPEGSRVQATLGTDIARKGSNFTIRKFTKDPLTPTHILRYGTMDAMQMAYLWLAIENKQSILISGGTATGKTSLLNALSLFIKPSLKVISIEDTAELRLPHPHWIPEVARSALEVKGRIGEVTLFDLLRSSLRQRPDYIIVGEVRGKEAYVLFQQIATGHAGLSTIHAASLPQLADRLTTPPISLPPTLLENINIIVFLVSTKLKGNYVRRTDSILEIAGLTASNKIDARTLFSWKPVSDSFEIESRSYVLKKIGERLGINDDAIKEELIRRKRILEWMIEKEIYDFREVAKVIAMYYSSPERIIDLVMTAEERY
jgi:flagellar protein FlaI